VAAVSPSKFDGLAHHHPLNSFTAAKVEAAVRINDFTGAEAEQILRNSGDNLSNIFRRAQSFDRSEPLRDTFS